MQDIDFEGVGAQEIFGYWSQEHPEYHNLRDRFFADQHDVTIPEEDTLYVRFISYWNRLFCPPLPEPKAEAYVFCCHQCGDHTFSDIIRARKPYQQADMPECTNCGSNKRVTILWGPFQIKEPEQTTPAVGTGDTGDSIGF